MQVNQQYISVESSSINGRQVRKEWVQSEGYLVANANTAEPAEPVLGETLEEEEADGWSEARSIFMVGMFFGGQGQPCRRDLCLKGEKDGRRMGVEGNRDFGLDFVWVGEDGCGERERRIRQQLYIT